MSPILILSVFFCILFNFNCSLKHEKCTGDDKCCLYGKRICDEDRPQFISIVVEGQIDYKSYSILRRIMPTRRRNQPPLGLCSAGLTIAVTRSKTDECLLKDIAIRGHEIIAGSKSYIWPPPFWVHASKEQWFDELNDIKSIINNVEVKGAKAPHFAIGGDAQYQALSEMDISYDISTVYPWSKKFNQPLWPYKLNTSIAWETGECGMPMCKGKICWKPKCPKESYPIWEFPAFEIKDNLTKQTCATIEHCKFDNETHVVEVLFQHFLKFNETNRAPFIIHLNIRDLIKRPLIVDGIAEFLRKGAQDKQYRNFFIITPRQLLSYLENPTSFNDLSTSDIKCPNITQIDKDCIDEIPDLELDRIRGLPIFEFLGNGVTIFALQTCFLLLGFLLLLKFDGK
ncbi:unnamed protein product [Dimorphilus gyrociliatus]|uniref:Uncharacterized protein n=1 Tax=Dimorphilus gyrociliatus TaxID=2664684 RepID=A0A7I8VGL8_9ANNE|nr:unnamed protein product [Dimorphilus gyrociliatus]